MREGEYLIGGLGPHGRGGGGQQSRLRPRPRAPPLYQPLRVAEFDALFAERPAGVSRPDRLRLHLLLTGGQGAEESVRDLVTRESGCCSFFTFTVTAEANQIHVDVEVDGAHEAVLDALQARAAEAAGLERS